MSVFELYWNLQPSYPNKTFSQRILDRTDSRCIVVLSLREQINIYKSANISKVKQSIHLFLSKGFKCSNLFLWIICYGEMTWNLPLNGLEECLQFLISLFEHLKWHYDIHLLKDIMTIKLLNKEHVTFSWPNKILMCM